jgi:hypothetical protein
MAIEKKSKFWGLIWSYQLNITANSAHFAHFLGKQAELSVLFSWLLQNCPQDFSIATGVNYSFKVKIIEIWVPTFFMHDN